MASRYCSSRLGREQRHFQLPANHGQGRAQLVRDIGGELPDLLERAVQAHHHVIEGFDQPVQFVASAARRNLHVAGWNA